MNAKLINPTPSVYLADIARRLEIDGKKVHKLQTGDPDFPTHPAVIEAASKALQRGETHYSFSQGLPSLRRKLAEKVNNEINSDFTEANVLITHGAVQGLYAVLTCLLEPGDEVIILEPNWPTVDSIIQLCGAKSIKVNFLQEDLFDKLEKVFNQNTKAIYINFPNNPTGAIPTEATMSRLLTWSSSKNLFILADEVYRYLQYETNFSSLRFARDYEKYIFIDSFSKKYAMTGWRVGYIVAPVVVLNQVLKVSQVMITNVSPFVQLGALEAISNIEVDRYCFKMLEEYRRRRDFVQEEFKKHNIEHISPSGAFYFFIGIGPQSDDVAFARNLLEKNGVCVVPGRSYGKAGEGFIRISYSIDMDSLKEAINLIIRMIGQKGI